MVLVTLVGLNDYDDDDIFSHSLLLAMGTNFGLDLNVWFIELLKFNYQLKQTCKTNFLPLDLYGGRRTAAPVGLDRSRAYR